MPYPMVPLPSLYLSDNLPPRPVKPSSTSLRLFDILFSKDFAICGIFFKIDLMNKLVSLALLVGGIALIVFGITATNSFSSDVSRFFTGSPTDKAIWMLIGGCIAAVIGLAGSMRNWKQT